MIEDIELIPMILKKEYIKRRDHAAIVRVVAMERKDGKVFELFWKEYDIQGVFLQMWIKIEKPKKKKEKNR